MKAHSYFKVRLPRLTTQKPSCALNLTEIFSHLNLLHLIIHFLLRSCRGIPGMSIATYISHTAASESFLQSGDVCSGGRESQFNLHRRPDCIPHCCKFSKNIIPFPNLLKSSADIFNLKRLKFLQTIYLHFSCAMFLQRKIYLLSLRTEQAFLSCLLTSIIRGL